MENKLKNKTFIITGASRGIGFELVKFLLPFEVRLILIASKESSFGKLKSLVSKTSEFNSNNSEIIYYPIDLSNSEEIKKAEIEISSKFGKIDFLINNAGIGIFKKLIDFNFDEFDNLINVNLKAPFGMIKSVLPEMINQKSGVIINVLSVVAKTPFANSSIYGATKAGLLQMTECLRMEVREYGIKIINVFPGATATEIWSPKALEKLSHKMLNPEDVAETVFEIIKLSTIQTMMIEDIQIRPQGGDL
jgi:short-subunit dehydrogenase